MPDRDRLMAEALDPGSSRPRLRRAQPDGRRRRRARRRDRRRGYHRSYGGPHAEVEALAAAGDAAAGADVYVTLEPCTSFGKTPPCTDALIGAGVTRVVFATADPDPRHRGAAVEVLRGAGIEVVEGPRGDAAGRVARTFSPLLRGRVAIRSGEVGQHARWSDRRADGRFQVDHRGGGSHPRP